MPGEENVRVPNDRTSLRRQSSVIQYSILELDDIFKRYAFLELKRTSGFFKKLFLDDDYVFEVDWSSLSLDHRIVKFSPTVEDGTEIETNWGLVTTGSRWVPLWSTVFENKADAKQSHNFRGSRDTTTWVDIDLDQCYTVGKQVSVEVNIPPNFRKFRAGRDNSFSLNKFRGQAYKEVINWEVNSQVEVLPGWRANAQLLAKEECNSMEFEIRTTLSSPIGVVPVHLKNKSDLKTKHTVLLTDFKAAFELVEDGGVLTPEEKACVQVMMQHKVGADGKVENTSFPQIITKGSCVSVSWSDQKVDITTSPLGEEGSRDGDAGQIISRQLSQRSEHEFQIKAN